MKQFFTLLLVSLGFSGLWAQVTSQQIGSASNAYSTYLSGEHCLSYMSGTGTNGGSLSFIHRENTAIHTGGSSGRLRFATSVNGGSTWTTEKGPATPLSSFLSRYPQGVLFNPIAGSSNINDLELAIVAPTLNATGAGFEGHLVGLVDSAATSNFAVEQEQYLYRNPGGVTRIPRSLVQRVPGEFFYVSVNTTGTNPVRNVEVYRGRYDSANARINWSLLTTLNSNYRAGALQPQGLQIAFDPTGTTGYVAYVGDITGPPDSVYSPVFWETTNGGVTWSTPFELNMRQFPGLRYLLQQGPGGTGNPTCGSNYPSGSNIIPNCTDLTVDANGSPHFFALVGNATAAATFGMDDSKYLLVDFTKDSLGNWCGMYISPKATRRGTFGDPMVTSGSLAIETWLQVTRTEDGTKLFYSWTETDTSASGWTPLLDNNAPDLYGRAYEVNTGRTTPIVNWTQNDSFWSGQVLTPIVANAAITRGNTYSVPTMAMRFQTLTTSALNPVSYWYISDINYDQTDFNDSTICFSSCTGTSVAFSLLGFDDNCGNNDGAATPVLTNPANNPGPYLYFWADGQRGDTAVNLTAGTYSLTLMDGMGCLGNDTVSIISDPGPQVDSLLSSSTSCIGTSDGMAGISITGGLAPFRYLWSSGDTTTSISGLPTGIYTITITDGNGCVLDTSVQVDEPTPISLAVGGADPVCFGGANGSAGVVAGGGTPGYTYRWSNGDTSANTSSTLSAGTYVVVVTDNNGCKDSTSVTLNDPPDIFLTTTVFDVSCFMGVDGSVNLGINGGTAPFTFAWSNGVNSQNLGAVGAGTYLVTVTDLNGCTKVDSATVIQPDQILPTVTATDISCFGQQDGSVDLMVAGGVPPYTFNWSNGASTQNLSGLGKGTYLVTIKDANNCIRTAQGRVVEPARLILNGLTTPDNGTGNGTATANISGGSPPYDVSWNTGQTGSVATGLFAGNYIVTVVDERGCTAIDTVLVGSNVGIEDLLAAGIRSLDIYPNPNAGNFFVRFELDRPEALELRLFDPTGRLLYHQKESTPQRGEVAVKIKKPAAGLYFLWVQTSRGAGTFRVMVR